MLKRIPLFDLFCKECFDTYVIRYHCFHVGTIILYLQSRKTSNTIVLLLCFGTPLVALSEHISCKVINPTEFDKPREFFLSKHFNNNGMNPKGQLLTSLFCTYPMLCLNMYMYISGIRIGSI